jgi:hypothetical protein
VRRIVVVSGADAPWEKCARRTVPLVAADLLILSAEKGRTPLHCAQHVAARRRAERMAGHLDHAAALTDLGLKPDVVDDDRWRGPSAMRSSHARASRSRGRWRDPSATSASGRW